MIAFGIGRHVRPQNVAGPQIALEQPRLAWGLPERCRDPVAWCPRGEPQQGACGIDMNADYAKEIAVRDEIGASPVLGNANDLALRKAADEPFTRNRIAGESLGKEIGIRDGERWCATNKRGPVALQASPNRTEFGGAIRAGADVREATEPTEGGSWLTNESEPTCDRVNHTRVVGRPPSERLGVVEIVAVAACREGAASMHSEARSIARRRGSLRAEQRWRQEQGPRRPAEDATHERSQMFASRLPPNEMRVSCGASCTISQIDGLRRRRRRQLHARVRRHATHGSERMTRRSLD